MNMSWEQARQRARQLEVQISDTIAEYSELSSVLQRQATGVFRSSLGASGGGGGGGDVELLHQQGRSQSASSPQQVHDQLQAQLAELGHICNLLHSSGSSAGSHDHATIQSQGRLAQRFATFYRDSVAEFRKIRSEIHSAQSRLELLGGGPSDRLSASGVQPKTELLLREKSSLYNSLAMAEQAIVSAQDARAGLDSQRKTFAQITGNLGTLGTRFPVIRKTIGQIRSKKHRDTVVLSSVMAILIIFTLWYTSNNQS